tara:strand:+ start:848 stop:1405 length:558 start_codon:yes stop_codon:yes gene_type:complete
MVLYLLRHEIRNPESLDFESSLTSIGKHNSKIRLFSKLSNIDIDEIYSSPYKRALETVKFYSDISQNPIKIDWALSEYIDNSCRTRFRETVFPNIEEQNYIHKNYNIDKEYIPTTDSSYITTYNETKESLERRVDNFILYIYSRLDKNILVVTHKTICSLITNRLMGVKKDIDMGQCFKLDFCQV